MRGSRKQPFLTLISSAFAIREKCPLVSGTPENRDDLVREIKDVIQREHILQSLWGWNNTIRLLEDEEAPSGDVFLLRLDTAKRTLNTRSYAREALDAAQRDYELAEKETEKDPNTQVVLVAVEDLDALRRAYPNNYVDTSGFLDAVTREIGITNLQIEPQAQPSEQQELPLSGAEQPH